MKTLNRFFIFMLLVFALACEQSDTDFESFLTTGEIIYPGAASNLTYLPGNERVGLVWNPSPDPSIEKYVVYWNNKKDSLIVPARSHDPGDTIMAVVSGLDEYVYSFTVFAYDAKGNKSVPRDINNVKVYGPFYGGSLFNRPFDVNTPYVVQDDGSVTLNFTEPDTINITTTIRYTNTSDQVVEKELGPDANSITLYDYKSRTAIQYKSSYIPMRDAIDVFDVAEFSTFPQIYAQVKKSLITALNLPNDVQPYEGGTSISKLWDGSSGPQGYPNIWHSNGDSPLPHHFSFDLGKLYDLSHVEITGRDCCHNPDQFEIWGIADLTNAETSLPGNDGGWKDESISKGWVLLKEVSRSDDGKAPYKVAMNENLPLVRYIRIRVNHVVSNDGSYSNASEITFWSKL